MLLGRGRATRKGPVWPQPAPPDSEPRGQVAPELVSERQSRQGLWAVGQCASTFSGVVHGGLPDASCHCEGWPYWPLEASFGYHNSCAGVVTLGALSR